MKKIVSESLDVNEIVGNKAYKLGIYYRDLKREIKDE